MEWFLWKKAYELFRANNELRVFQIIYPTEFCDFDLGYLHFNYKGEGGIITLDIVLHHFIILASTIGQLGVSST